MSDPVNSRVWKTEYPFPPTPVRGWHSHLSLNLQSNLDLNRPQWMEAGLPHMSQLRTTFICRTEGPEMKEHCLPIPQFGNNQGLTEADM